MRSWAKAAALAVATTWAMTLHAAPATGQVQRVKGFRLPQYDKENRLVSEIVGDEAEMLPNGDIRVFKVRVEFRKDGKLDTVIEAGEGYFNRAEDTIGSDSAIRIENPAMIVTGVGWKWDRRDEKASIRSAATVELKNSKGWLTQEAGDDAR